MILRSPAPASELTELRLVSVNVGQPTFLGTVRGKRVSSAIRKEPVLDAELDLETLNLAGDRQADLRVHGGPDKAVYAYPSEHLERWQAELGLPMPGGFFGENLTTAGASESDVCIGDIWAWGEARLQISQPRSPCFKLALRAGRPDLPKRLTQNGRTGWYLRVLRPARVGTTGSLTLIHRDSHAVSVLDAHRAAFSTNASPDLIHRALLSPALAEAWRNHLQSRLELARQSS